MRAFKALKRDAENNTSANYEKLKEG
jgi:hypothetical protein